MLIKLNGLKSAEEAMDKAGMAWSVEPVEIFTGSGKDVVSHSAICRGDTGAIVGVVGRDSYVPIQNHTVCAFADVIAQKYGATFEYAGIIKGGRRLYLQACLDDNFEAQRGDRIDCHVTMVWSHDGSCAVKCFLTPYRIWCENQLNRAIKGATTNISLRHTASVESRIQDAFQVFGMSTHAFAVFREKARYLARKVADRQMVEKFLDSVVGEAGDSTRIKNQREKITQLFESGKGNHGQNAFELYNGAGEWIDHYRGSDPEKRLDSAMFGGGATLKGKAFEAAMVA